MASTYALPTAPASNSGTPHSHGRAQSQYAIEPSPYPNSPLSGASPSKEHAHRHYRPEMHGNGQLHGAVRSPYTEYNGHTHDCSQSTDSSYTLKPFLNGRPKGRPRGESDLGRAPQRKAAASAKYGFSPIHESAPAPAPTMSSS
jgi:zinc transporter 5/7